MTFSSCIIDSFDAYTSITQLSQKSKRFDTDSVVPILGTGHVISSSNARGTGGNALFLPSGAGWALPLNSGVSISIPYACAALAKASASNRRVLNFYDSGTPGRSLSVEWRADGFFEFFNRSNVSIGTSAHAYTSLAPNYYYLQVCYSIGATSAISVYVDGTLDKTFTNIDTRPNGTGTTITQVQYGGDSGVATTGSDMYVDDVFIFRETGAFTNKSVGNLQVEVIVPTADVTTEFGNSGGTVGNNYSYVDEEPPDTSDYIIAPAGGSISHDDKYSWSQAHLDPAINKIIAMGFQAYALGSTVVDARLRGVLTYSGVGSAASGVLVSNGGGSLQNVQGMYGNTWNVPMPNDSGSGTQSTSMAGISGTDFNTNFKFGPRMVRSGVPAQPLRIYQFVIEVVKNYYNPSKWHVGKIGWS